MMKPSHKYHEVPVMNDSMNDFPARSYIEDKCRENNILDPLPIADVGIQVVDNIDITDSSLFLHQDKEEISSLLSSVLAADDSSSCAATGNDIAYWKDQRLELPFSGMKTSFSPSFLGEKLPNPTTSSTCSQQPPGMNIDHLVASTNASSSTTNTSLPCELSILSRSSLNCAEDYVNHHANLLLPLSNHETKNLIIDDKPSPSSSAPVRVSQSCKWFTRYQELCEYKRIHGDCHVIVNHSSSASRMNHHGDDAALESQIQLSKWVKRQRYQMKLKMQGKHSTLTSDREQLLNDIGFVWDSHCETWEEHFQQLLQFKETHGHCNVPSNFKENKKLSIWVKYQRQRHKLFCKGIMTNMTDERVKKLTDVGFSWQIRGDGSCSSSLSSSSSTC